MMSSLTRVFTVSSNTCNGAQVIISLPGQSPESYCITPGVGVGVGVGGGISKKFNVKVFYVLVKALSGELSCPCDRSCIVSC